MKNSKKDLESTKIAEILQSNSAIRLDIGCGTNKQKGWIGMDSQPFDGVDVVHDLLDFPWPFPDESVSMAMSSHVLEHIPKVAIVQDGKKLKTIYPLIMVFNEIWRIMKADGPFLISLPHAASPGFMRDPTHAAQFTEQTFLYLDPIAPGALGYLWGFYKGMIKPWKIKTEERGEPIFYFDPSQNIEVVLSKRREDKSYYEG